MGISQRPVLFSICLGLWSTAAAAAISECNTSEDCHGECLDIGVCSNPFERGCLHASLPGWDQLRVCNSEDPPDAATSRGVCRVPDPDLHYMEVRLSSQNWESVAFEAWILQVLLSEILGVPTSIETGYPDVHMNLYDASSPFEYGTYNDWESVKRAQSIKDCSHASRNPDNYETCAHLIPEMWDASMDTIQDLSRQGVIESQHLGALGHAAWFMPKFTVERENSLLMHFGLSGEDNRRKLADLFLRPTTWQDYCDFVSPSNCLKSDGVAQRAPKDETEQDRMFVEGLYTGHFRKTEENNCDANPTTCTGHIADHPCDWASYVSEQTRNLGIPLKSSGAGPNGAYTYSQQVELWRAANATKSNLVMVWWTPEALVQQFAGTDAEFTRISLPDPTLECIEARKERLSRCQENYTELVSSDARGKCDTQAQALRKIVSAGLYDATYDPSIPEPLRSPAYNAIELFSVNELQLGELLRNWQTMSSPREAVCHWVMENLDYLHDFVPASYPRVVKERSSSTNPLVYATTVTGAISCLLVLIIAWMVYQKRTSQPIKHAQIEFLWLILSGAMLVSVGAVVGGAPPTDASCVSVIWLVNLGYCLELVPLIVKVAAINRLMQAAKKMKRFTLQRKTLYGAVILVTVLVAVYLVNWSVLDPPRRKAIYELTEGQTQEGSTIVLVDYYCSSASGLWWIVAVAWNTLLLVWATVLAYETRHARPEFNESQTLAVMTYSQFVFFVGWMITLFLATTKTGILFVAPSQSFLWALSTIAVLVIYFGFKLCPNAEANEAARKAGLGITSMSSIQVSSARMIYTEYRASNVSQHGHSVNSAANTSQVSILSGASNHAAKRAFPAVSEGWTTALGAPAPAPSSAAVNSSTHSDSGIGSSNIRVTDSMGSASDTDGEDLAVEEPAVPHDQEHAPRRENDQEAELIRSFLQQQEMGSFDEPDSASTNTVAASVAIDEPANANEIEAPSGRQIHTVQLQVGETLCLTAKSVENGLELLVSSDVEHGSAALKGLVAAGDVIVGFGQDDENSDSLSPSSAPTRPVVATTRTLRLVKKPGVAPMPKVIAPPLRNGMNNAL